MDYSELPTPCRYVIAYWLLAMARGDYEQAMSRLRKKRVGGPEEHCATGVACDLFARWWPDIFRWDTENLFYYPDHLVGREMYSEYEPPMVVIEALGWDYSCSAQTLVSYAKEYDEDVAIHLGEVNPNKRVKRSLRSWIVSMNDTGMDFEAIARTMHDLYRGEMDIDLPADLLEDHGVNGGANIRAHLHWLGVSQPAGTITPSTETTPA